MREAFRKMLLSMIAVLLLGGAFQTASALNVKVKAIATGLQSPVDLKEAPDGSGRLFIMEQTGTIRVVMPNGTMLPEAFLDLRASIVKQYVRFDERGAELGHQEPVERIASIRIVERDPRDPGLGFDLCSNLTLSHSRPPDTPRRSTPAASCTCSSGRSISIPSMAAPNVFPCASSMRETVPPPPKDS